MRLLNWINLFIIPFTAAWFIYGIGAGTIHADFIVWWWAFGGLFLLLIDTLQRLIED